MVSVLYRPGLSLGLRELKSSGLIAYPTEAVWGLGCLPHDYTAVQRLLKLKSRPQHKGLILVSGDRAHFAHLLEGLTVEQEDWLEQTWPGPNTWLVPHRQRVPDWISGGHQSVAIRVSAHPVIRALSQAVGGPIVSTSANPQGLAPARTGWRAKLYFGDQVYYVPGQVGRAAKPSQIRDLATGQILRPA